MKKCLGKTILLKLKKQNKDTTGYISSGYNNLAVETNWSKTVSRHLRVVIFDVVDGGSSDAM